MRIEKTTQPSTLLSLSLSLSRPRSKLLTFYHARSSTRATTRCTLDRNVNRIRGLLFPVPRKIHFPSEEGSAPPHPRLIFSFRFTRVPLAFDTAKRRRLIASINDDTFYRGFSPLPLPPNTRHSETVFMDLYRSTWYVARGSNPRLREWRILRFIILKLKKETGSKIQDEIRFDIFL